MMLDVARHFFGVAEIERLIDLLALYKLNRLHLHLTDDQGWRLALRSRPRLTRLGSSTAVGGGPGGHFTQRDYRRIVAYAAERFVEIVPEIDMPGHVNAALSAYGELACDGIARVPYTGIDVGFSSLCIRSEETYAFVDDVVGEVAALTPGPYLHIGGDEPLSTDPDDYRFFVGRVQRIVRAHGKRMLGWEEIARAAIRRTTLVQHWHDPQLARAAVARGAKLVLSPAPKTYLDMKYTRSSPLGLAWAGTTSVRAAYELGPGDARGRRGGAGRRRRGGSALVGDDLDPRRARPPRLPTPARRRGDRLVGRRGPLMARVSAASRRPRAAPRRPRRRLPPRHRRAVVSCRQRLPVTDPRPVFSSAPGHEPQ